MDRVVTRPKTDLMSPTPLVTYPGEKITPSLSPSGQVIQVTHRGGFASFESEDGKTIYYAKGLDVPGWWSVPAQGGEELKLISMPKAGYWGFWAPLKGGIYYLDTSDKPRIYSVNLLTHETGRVSDLEAPTRQTPGFTISTDGKSILYTHDDQSVSEISLVSNFR